MYQYTYRTGDCQAKEGHTLEINFHSLVTEQIELHFMRNTYDT